MQKKNIIKKFKRAPKENEILLRPEFEKLKTRVERLENLVGTSKKRQRS